MVKERADASQVARFFRVLLSDFSQKLPLPRAFVKLIATERHKRRAKLVNPNGVSWQVRIFSDGDEEGACFGGDSWRNFLDAHNLRPGFFLVFCYRGNMAFDFCAYDLSTCEIAYPPVGGGGGGGGGGPRRRRRRGPGTRPPRAPRKRRGVGAEPGDANDERSKAPPNSRSSRGRATSPHICFESRMTFYNLTKAYMYFPLGVIRQCSELRHLKEITLKDPKLRLWGTQLYHRKSPRSEVHIARGWLEFAQANKLNIGDRCVFELVPQRKKKMMMNVQIIRKT